ncbi:MAG: DUF1385 domain-containing protein [Christensenellales bacterium]|jgi:uncharacterized protein YqhQ
MADFKAKFRDWFFGRRADGAISVGGQAVMEGVMMQSPKKVAVAVRQSSGKIVYTVRDNKRLSEKYPILGYPLIRGCVSFVMSLVTGMKTLTESADMAGLDAEEPSKFEKKVAEILRVKPEDVVMGLAVFLAIAMSIGLFFALPTGIEALLKKFVSSKFLLNLLGGIVRICVFLLYIWLCSRLKEIRRVFQYHGAEHKSIFCFESGEELTVENARKFTTQHPRCGTSFLVIVMVISILIFILLGSDSANVFQRLGSRLLLLPLVAGISYEVLKGLAYAEESKIVRLMKAPGLMVQKITTQPPDDAMLEVALVALRASLGMDIPETSAYSGKDEPPAIERIAGKKA